MYDIERDRTGAERIKRKGYRVGIRNAAYRISLTPCPACRQPIGCDRDFFRVRRSRDGLMQFFHRECTTHL